MRRVVAGSLNSRQVASFERDGFLVLPDVLSESDLAPVHLEYQELLSKVGHRLSSQGVLSSRHDGLDFGARYSAMIGESAAVFQHIDITYPVQNPVPREPSGHFGPAVFSLLTDPKILDIVESVIGPEILSNPTQHLRLKPPEKHLRGRLAKGYIGRTQWHQDLAGLLDEALETDLLTVWIAVSDAMEENGCLVAIPASHKAQGGTLTPHCPESETVTANYIAGRRLATGSRVALPVARGGIVLLHKLVQHASLPNKSDQLRFAFDLRYQPVGQPTGRPGFPAFLARSTVSPDAVLADGDAWKMLWQSAFEAIATGRYPGPIYETARWEEYGGQPPC